MSAFSGVTKNFRENLKARFRAQQVVLLQDIEVLKNQVNSLGVNSGNILLLLLLCEVFQSTALR